MSQSNQTQPRNMGNQAIAHNSAPKQRLKSATMNKRIQRGFSRENDDGYDESQQQLHGYQGHLSNTDMPPVN